ncbi:uncharacterized protein BT62DRAFT_997144 [Guyanagaster necrorhizus]|uniref:Uncharacterized protein n=1 Tax=Guyanagaster necrorhizus TaxID=856835 RepID=A0A9P7VI77_9AGAR|nr:uncharacterized protein BT62DRAFT_997144 [Guyanagaster necrorhizus MCA 3950]KAG7441526.1 hypothetical protein BT62DRAFT_997144 [Guyanagaster necrorhizus MCA 3950]
MVTTDEDGKFLDRFIGGGDGRIEEQYTCCPHCECAMLAALLQRWKKHQSASVIGVSKLSCFGCRLFFTAYRDVCSQLPGIDWPPSFVMTGAHNNLYLP